MEPEAVEQITTLFLELNDAISDRYDPFVTHIIERVLTHNLYEETAILDSVCMYPVTCACECGRLDVVKNLIEHNFDPNHVNVKEDENIDGFHAKFTNSPIHSACYHGHLHIVQYLVEEHGASVNSAKRTPYTPLYSAIIGGHLNIVKYLVDNGASLDSDDKRKQLKSPIHLVASVNNLDLVEYLLSLNMDVNCKDRNDQTALHHVIRTQAEVGVVRALLEAGANVNASSLVNTKSPLMLATYSNNLEVIKLLYSYGADPLGGVFSLEKPLSVAVVSNFYNIVRYFVVDLNLPLDEGEPGEKPLHLAVRWQHIGIINLLLKAGSSKKSVQQSVHIHGKSISPTQLRILDLYNEALKKPRSLEDICCLKIRKVLGRRLPKIVDTLPLPTLLINIVKLGSIPRHK